MLLFYLVLQPETQKKINTLLKGHLTPHETALDFEFYAERSFHDRYLFEIQKSKSWSYHQGGLHLLLSQGGIPQSLLSNDLHSCPHLKWSPLPQKSPSTTQSDVPKLDRLCRNLLLRFPSIKNLKARLEKNLKEFIFSSDQVEETQGMESYFLLSFYLEFEKNSQLVMISKSFTRQDGNLLLADASQLLASQEQVEKFLITPWPAPQGEIPVLWSEESMSRWVLLLLQLLSQESKTKDRFETFCQRLPPLTFQIIDNWKPGMGFDSEGNSRKETFLIGPQNEIPPFFELKGFSRRSSFEQFPVTVPWQPALFGENRTSSLLKEMKKGISIHDFDLLHFDTQTADAKLKINRAYLVHDGKEGDPIEPLEWTVSIFEVLKSLELFSDEIQPQPRIWKTANQEFFVEINAPQALSQTLNFPGSVPLNYYW